MENNGFLCPSAYSPTDRQGLLKEFQRFLLFADIRIDLTHIAEDEGFARPIAHDSFCR